MAQWWLRTLTAFPEDPRLISNTHMVAYNSLRESDTLIWPFRASGTHVVHRHKCKEYIHTHKMKSPKMNK